MDVTRFKKRSALWLLPAFLFASSVAVAGEQEDFRAIHEDWRADGQVTPCKWSREQLENAHRVASGSPDFQYSTEFPDDVEREIARWRAGGCAGVSPEVLRRRSPLRGVRIVGVAPRGGAAREYVRIRNTTRRTVSLRRATLRNRRGQRATFPSRFRLGPGRTALVRVGCARGRSAASFRGLRVHLCRSRALFTDSGDAARLADARGVFVSQRGFGRWAALIRY